MISGDCVNWTGSLDRHGYGRLRLGRRNARAHRLAYEKAHGPIPDGLVIDHLCRNRRCVNPAHLEATTVRENTLRGNGPGGLNARKTHCPKGHELAGANVYVWRNMRHCRECVRQHNVAWRRTKAVSL